MNVSKPRPKKYSNRELTTHLRELAATLHDCVEEYDIDSGRKIPRARTKGQALAEEVFKRATGWSEEREDDEGNVKQVYHKPESWAIALIWDRMEGKTPQAVAEDETRVKAKDKVSDMAKQRINALVPAAIPEPPSLPRKKDAE